MRCLGKTLVAALLALPSCTQDPEPPAKDRALPAEDRVPPARYRELKRQYYDAVGGGRDGLGSGLWDLLTEGEIVRPQHAVVPRFLEEAKRVAGTAEAYAYLVFAIEKGLREVRDEAVPILVRDHAGDERLVEFLSRISLSDWDSMGPETADLLLGTLANDGKSPGIRAQAMFLQSMLTARQVEVATVDLRRALEDARRAVDLTADRELREQCEFLAQLLDVRVELLDLEIPEPEQMDRLFAQLEERFLALEERWSTLVGPAPETLLSFEVADFERLHPRCAFIMAMSTAAAEYRGEPEALPFLIWLMEQGDMSTAISAKSELTREHLQSPRIARLLRTALRDDRDRLDSSFMDLMAPILQLNRTDEVLGLAHLLRGKLLMARFTTPRQKRFARGELEKAMDLLDDPEWDAQAKEAMETPTRRNEREASVARAETGPKVGETAPEIEGEDLDGVAFKLSDYRGKVVVLDFWGDW